MRYLPAVGGGDSAAIMCCRQGGVSALRLTLAVLTESSPSPVIVRITAEGGRQP